MAKKETKQAEKKPVQKAQPKPKAEKKPAEVDPVTVAERSKYERMWGIDDYRRTSPAERDIKRFFNMCEPTQPQTILDLGCGTGRAALEIFHQGFNVTMFDIAANCLDPEAKAMVEHPLQGREGEFSFVEGCAWETEESLKEQEFDWVFCFDVMEHIPEERVDAVLAQIAKRIKVGAFFQICTIGDGFGRRIDEVLHVTIRPNEWWLAKLAEYFDVVSHEWNPAHIYVRVQPKG